MFSKFTDYLSGKAINTLIAGDVFGPGGEGYLRMSYATDFDNITEGCRRLKEAVEALHR